MTQLALKLIAVSALFMATNSNAIAAFEFSGSKSLSVITADGTEHELGQVHFTEVDEEKAAFELDLDIHRFTDYFLSMKEFKCVPSESEVTCHVPYPYDSPKTVSANNLTWLEHRLLFLFKKPKEFGARLWNGIYFQLAVEGDTLVGTPQAIDLNDISAPPEDLTIPPYTNLNRHPMPSSERWVRSLKIQ